MIATMTRQNQSPAAQYGLAPLPARKPAAPNASKQNNLNFLRFALALLVIAAHSVIAVNGNERRDLLARLTGGQIYSGAAAVDAFFLISGFLITQSWLNSKSFGDYLRKRSLRIYPGFLACSFLCLFVVAPILYGSFSGFFHDLPWRTNLRLPLLLNVLEIRSFARIPMQSVDGQLWTIAPEFLCYLLAAALGLLAVYRSRKVTLALFATSWLLYAAQTATNRHFFVALPLHLGGQVDAWPRLITCFMAGMCFYFFREEIRYAPRLLAAGLALLAVASLTHALLYVLPLCGGYALFYFAFSPKINLHRFGHKTDLTYGIYLYGWPIQQLLIKFLPNLSILTLTLLALPLSCLAAFASWKFVEKPFLKRKPKPASAPVEIAGENLPHTRQNASVPATA